MNKFRQENEITNIKRCDQKLLKTTKQNKEPSVVNS